MAGKRERPERQKPEGVGEDVQQARTALIANRIRGVTERLAEEQHIPSGILWGLLVHRGELEELYAEEMLLLKG